MLLHAGEQMLRSAYAVIEEPHRPSDVRGPGVLYLTNQRLVFEAPTTAGLVRDLLRGHDNRTVFSGSLLDIRNVSVRRGRIGKTWLVVEMARERPAFDVLDPDGWIRAIALAKRALPVPGSGAPTIVEREVVRVRCRYCGRLGNEVDGRCPSCGAPL